VSAAVRISYGTLWVVTIVAAAAALLTGLAIIEVGPPYDALDASIATAANLLAHNALVALWPLGLTAQRWAETPGSRTVADVVVAGQIVMHGLVVGGAIGQQPELWRYLPHLPFEWLGLALPAAGWLLARDGALTRRTLAGLAATTIAALFVAAVLETWAVPL